MMMATARQVMESTMMAMARRATTTMITIATALGDRTMTRMATDVVDNDNDHNDDDDDEGNDASLMTSDKGDNPNRDNGKPVRLNIQMFQ